VGAEGHDLQYRGYAIEDLIGHVSFSGMIWLMLRENRGQTKKIGDKIGDRPRFALGK